MPGSRSHPHEDLPVDPDLEGRWVPPTATGETSLMLVVIGLGGALGSLARYALAETLPSAASGLPWATFLANVSGSLLLGLLMVLVVETRRANPYVRPFLGVGVLGGYTTFSTYTSEIRALLVEGQAPTGLAYLFLTLASCLLATLVGIRLGRRVEAHRA